MSDIREAFEALIKYRKAYDEMYQMLGMFLDAEEGLEKPDIDQAWSAFNQAPGPVYWEKIEAALQQTAPAVPEGWRTAKGGEQWPHIGGKYLIKLNGVLQHEIYEFDQADDGCGGGEYFWDRDDLDEAAPFDPENDSWLPIDQAGVTTSAVPDVTAAEELASALREIEGTVNRTATSDQFIRHLKQIATDALAAAPKPDHIGDAGKVVQGKNRYGLDMGYFSRLIAREFDDLSNFRPDEFARVCARMAATADASVLQEKEFRPAPVPVPWPKKEDITEDMRAGFERLYRAEAERDGRTLERNEQGAYKHLTVDRDWTFYQRVWADALEATAPAADGGEVEPAAGRVQTNPGARSAIYSFFESFEKAQVYAHHHENAGHAEPLYTHLAQPRNMVQAEAILAAVDYAKANSAVNRGRGAVSETGVFEYALSLLGSTEGIFCTRDELAARLRSNGGDA